ncbi:MAG: VanZ family protein [Gammaproteobacteria bacterium]|jgi:VanZ family protein
MQLGVPGRVGSEEDVLAGMVGVIIVLITSSLIKTIAIRKKQR